MTLKERILEVKAANPDWGYVRIANEVGCNDGTVRFHINPEYNASVIARRRARRRGRKEMLIELMGGKCKVCKYNGCTNAMDFHHLDPNKKEFTPKELNSMTDKQAVAEVKNKCVLLCCRCHREIHSGVTKL